MEKISKKEKVSAKDSAINKTENEVILVSDDNGMGNNKVTYGFNGVYYQFDFASRYKEVDQHSIDTTAFDDRIFNFSEGRLAVENGHPTKDDEIHEVLLKKALYEVYKKTGVKNFDVVSNYSLDSCKEDGGKKVTSRMSSIQSFTAKELYGEEVTLNINRVQCFPECLSGGLLVNLNLMEEDVVFIDMGTKNTQLIRVLKGVPNYEDSKATTKGMSFIYRGIADIIKTLKLGINDKGAVQMYLEQTKSGKLEIIPEIESKILDYLMENIFPEMDQCLTEMEVSPLFTKYVFLGGGSDLLSRFLDTKYMKNNNNPNNNNPIYLDDPYYATSLGLFKSGEKLFRYTPHKSEASVLRAKAKKASTKKTATSTRKTKANS